MRWMRYLAAVAVAGLVAACGGGGGSTSSTGGSNGGGTATPTMTVAVINSGGAVVTSVSVGGAAMARATLRDASGAAIAGRLVNFTVSDEAIAALSPATALTDASGVAQVSVEPASLSARGAASVTASATVGETAVTASTDFSVSASSLALSALSISPTALASGGNATVSTTASIAGVAAGSTPVNVAFSASCGRIDGQDTGSGGFSKTTNGSGVASVTYSAVDGAGQPCSGTVTVTASSAGASAQTGTLTVAAPVANTVTFVDATPQQIFVAGSGAAEQSVLRFRVLSSVGTSLASVPVRLSIETNPGGVGLDASGSPAAVTKTSDADGYVSVSAFSGTIPGAVKVRAALVSSPTVFAESQFLTVASGPPSQRFMSLSAGQFALEGWAVDGTSTTLTVRLADRQGNAVEDGTVINFTAEGGQVARSCATTRTANISSCSVTFVTQNPRPAGGRASVLAYTEGTKDYVDVNGNNIFDAGDTLVQIGDAYRDDNESNVFDAGEFVVPRGASGACTGAGGAFPSKSNTCDGGLATTVRQQAVLLFASTTPAISSVSATRSRLSFKLHSSDNLLLPMPAGTRVTATTSPTTCLIDNIAGAPLADARPTPGRPLEDLATTVALSLSGCAAGNAVTITVTAPSGLATTFPAVTLP
ncbi:Ig-like domain-containing protein [Pseudorhodoferax sp. Leaf265]|uniref:Ig-like domain-containing protein n=1 Tax=Pseudorhodoferax sp. Leaf265 TaxID=1736315 RepID=UPI0012E76836|nr:Ig-like domain-containing protein [Pseudorhodoferax sp. Leaf265]